MDLVTRTHAKMITTQQVGLRCNASGLYSGGDESESLTLSPGQHFCSLRQHLNANADRVSYQTTPASFYVRFNSLFTNQPTIRRYIAI
jgi:hypothetical protein